AREGPGRDGLRVEPEGTADVDPVEAGVDGYVALHERVVVAVGSEPRHAQPVRRERLSGSPRQLLGLWEAPLEVQIEAGALRVRQLEITAGRVPVVDVQSEAVAGHAVVEAAAGVRGDRL